MRRIIGAGGYLRDMTARSTLTAFLVVCATALGACGDSEKAADKGPTRPQYIADVNALCQKITRQSAPTNRKLQALVNASGTYTDRLKRSPPLLRTTLRLQTRKLEQFKAIEPPRKDVAQIKEITTASQAVLAQLRDAIDIAERGDLKEFIDIAFDENGARAKAERLGTTYGLRADCFTVPVDLQ
ncbi:MAG: hypothetical protein QOI73_1240 [Solirubrobacteraceae bacterium]|nr:hypothetical protein [Solirubrobacteraceae bacterium]